MTTSEEVFQKGVKTNLRYCTLQVINISFPGTYHNRKTTGQLPLTKNNGFQNSKTFSNII